MAGLFGDIISSLSHAAWYSVRRNSVDTDFETYDTRASRPLFEHFVTRTTTATTEQTLHLYNVARSQFSANGDTILAEYSGTLAANANDKIIRLYFAGTEIFDTDTSIDPALGNNKNWRVRVSITRKSTSVARCAVDFIVYGYNAATKYTEISSLDFPDRPGTSAGTAYDLKLTAETGTAAGDASLLMAEARFVNAVQCDLVTTSLWAYGEARYYKGLTATQYTDGANITTDWQDLSGNARHATRTGTPTAELSEVNGEAVVRYPGGSVYHTLPDMSALTQGSIFLVWKVTDVTTDAGCRFGTSGSTDHYPYTPDTPDGIYSDFGSTVRKTCGGSVSTITNYHCTYIWSKSNDWGLHQDGQKVYETTTNTVGFHSSPRIAHNGSAGMKVDLAAWYIFSVKLTDANVAKMYRYIQKEFGC